jgi:hypothetical protein
MERRGQSFKPSSWFQKLTQDVVYTTQTKRPPSLVFREVGKTAAGGLDLPRLTREAARAINDGGTPTLKRYVEAVVDQRGAAGPIERQIIAQLSGRVVAKIASDVFATRDPEFVALVHEADQARNMRNYGRAMSAYSAALTLYPLQAGYRVQLAHMYKEEGRFEDAELHYRSAAALGVEVEHVREHLSWTATRNEASVDWAAIERQRDFWEQGGERRDEWEVPTVAADVIDFADVLGLPPILSATMILSILRHAPFLRDLPSALGALGRDWNVSPLVIVVASLAERRVQAR